MTAETLHAPGTWWVAEDDARRIKVKSSRGVVANMAITPLSKFAPEGYANARLIAAAPELLAALIECRKLLDGEGVMPVGVRGRADAAIAKAIGATDHAR